MTMLAPSSTEPQPITSSTEIDAPSAAEIDATANPFADAEANADSPEADAPASAPAPAPAPIKWDSPENPFYQQAQETSKELQEVRAWRQQQEAERQKAATTQYQQQEAQRVAAFEQVLANALVDPAEAKQHSEVYRTGLQFQSPAFQQELSGMLSIGAEGAAFKHAFTELLSNLGPQTTLGQAQKLLQELLTPEPGVELTKGLVAARAKVLAQGARQTNRREAVQSGRETTEGGVSGGAAGYARRDAYANYVEALRTGAPLPPAAEIDRIVAEHFRSAR